MHIIVRLLFQPDWEQWLQSLLLRKIIDLGNQIKLNKKKKTDGCSSNNLKKRINMEKLVVMFLCFVQKHHNNIEFSYYFE